MKSKTTENNELHNQENIDPFQIFAWLIYKEVETFINENSKCHQKPESNF